MCLSHGRLFKTIHQSKPDPLWAWSCRLYSTILISTFLSSPLSVNENSKTLLIQSPPSKTKVSFLHYYVSYGVKSRLYLLRSLPNCINEKQYSLALSVLCVSRS